MQQLGLDLQLPDDFSFDNFLIGPNLAAFVSLKALASHSLPEQAIYLHGDAGHGKTHLLQAAVAWARQQGLRAQSLDARQTPDMHPEDTQGPPPHLLVIDHLDSLDTAGQMEVFSLYNAQKERAAAILCAGSCPPAAMPLREDLQTRLAWGLTFPILPPEDEDKATLLRHRAAARGSRISEEVCRYLVTHSPRDLGSLVRLLYRLDHAAVAARRTINLPFVREYLKNAEAAGPDSPQSDSPQSD